MSKPRVWLVPYSYDWSLDITARALVRHLSNRFEFRLAYTAEIEPFNLAHEGPIAEWEADCYVDLWWHGTLHYHLGRKVLKQISSHRWQQPRWGSLRPEKVLDTYADDVGAIAVPSRRLLELFRESDICYPPMQSEIATAPPARQFVLGQKGFDPTLFFDAGDRDGSDCRIGWAGAIEATDKHVPDLLAAWPNLHVAGGTTETAIAMMSTMRNARSYSYADMPIFYNAIDVIAIASDAEGDPRTLIEGMACGCFPVTTDVGIVPELITHLHNGYVIPLEERGPRAFVEAFEWCRANLGYVREAGRRNAEWMTNIRTWESVAPTWEHAIDIAIDRGASGVGPTRY